MMAEILIEILYVVSLLVFLFLLVAIQGSK